MAPAWEKLIVFLERQYVLHCKDLVVVVQVFAFFVPKTEHKAVQ